MRVQLFFNYSLSLRETLITKIITMVAARSVKITVENWTGRTWTKQALSLPGGIWMNNGGLVPPDVLPKVSLSPDGDPVPGVTEFGSESEGFMTGTEGSVTYVNEQGGSLLIGWNNPYIGGNGFGAQAPEGFVASLGVTTPGDNADITVSLRKG
jgi:hypothetical protein